MIPSPAIQIALALDRAVQRTAQPKLKVLDLFSGIGGFSLGLERTGGFETVAFCEIEDYPRRVLKKHWPKVPIYDDVRTLTADALSRDGIAVDVICGGFPCQDVSRAGKRAGIGGARSGLWSEFGRLVCELRPQFIIVENVSALLDDGMGVVCGDLASLGYDAEWHCISAAAVGAPHDRDRIWILAYPNEMGRKVPNQPFTGRSLSGYWLDRVEPIGRASEPHLVRMGNGFPDDVDRIAALGNAVVPQIPELIGRAILASLQAQQADDRTVTPTPA